MLVFLAIGMIGMRPTGAAAQDLRAVDRARVEDSVRVFLTRYVAAYESRDIRAVMALYPADGPVVSAIDGHVTTSRDTLASSIGRFLERLRQVSFSTEPPLVSVLDARTAAVTLVFHGTGTWNDNTAFSTTGSWTAVLGERGGRFAIIQEQESHPRAAATASGST